MERGDGGSGGGGMGPRGVGPPSAAMLGLEMHLAHPPQPQMHAFQQSEHHGAGGFQHQPVPVARQQQPPPSYSPYSAASSRVVKAGSHDDEMGNGAGRSGGAVQQPGVAGCPWTRMKWTDGMVRLLITVVYNVGDDGEGVGAAAVAGGGKAASHGKAGASAAHAHGQAAAQQKKGKWKSVSRAMMDKGFMVSPQQCEDKFNDLNKRYKRVVDLLGRGKACKVVENHALLDTMDELTPKAKDEARKLLSSKHLFFREMCAYHNSGAAAAAAASHIPHSAGEGAACFHHLPPAPMAGAAASSAGRQAAAPSLGMKDSSAGADEDDDDSEDVLMSNEVDDEDEDEDDEEEVAAPGIKHRGSHIYISHRLHHHQNGGHHKRRRGEDCAAAAAGEDEEEEEGNKRAHRAAAGSEEGPSAVQQLQRELGAAAAGGDPQQVRQWVRRRAVEVEEQQVAYECHAYQLERQRLKWERFRANKEREMERARLRNDRLRIDARRMLLMLRQKDLDFDIAEANSSSVEHHPSAHAPPLAALQQQLGSSPSTAGHPN